VVEATAGMEAGALSRRERGVARNRFGPLVNTRSGVYKLRKGFVVRSVAVLVATLTLTSCAGHMRSPNTSPTGHVPRVEEESGTVSRVIDGDTIQVALLDRRETVRLIGVDTPESVHPRKPVERFALEASAFVRQRASGKRVRMTGEPGTPNRDRYGRLLRYVYLDDGVLLNSEIIALGYGFAYTKYPFGRMEEFRALERQAREQRKGLWVDSDQQP